MQFLVCAGAAAHRRLCRVFHIVEKVASSSDRRVESKRHMPSPAGDSRGTPVPLHISRGESPRIRPTTAVYAVSLGGSKDDVGTVLIGTPKGVDALTVLLQKIGVGRSEIETACKVLAEQPYHQIPNVKLSATFLRRLGR